MLLPKRFLKMQKRVSSKDNPIVNGEESNEKTYSVKLTVSKSTKELIIEDCKEEFLKHHPELEGMKITENFIIRQIADFYLKEP